MAIFTAISGIVSAVGTFIGGLGAIGSFLLRTAVGVGLNLLAQAVAGKPKDPVFSINGELQGGGDLPRHFPFGLTATAGSLVWANTWGRDGDTANAYLTQVIALSDLPVNGLLRVWVDNQLVTLDLNTPNMSWGWQVKEFRNQGDNLWIKFYDGTQTEVDSFLVNTCSNQNRQWDRNRVGRGVAYVIVTSRVSKNMFNGIPTLMFEMGGCKLYDVSKDSTAGGNGSHRWSDPTTWGGDGDYLPAVQAYNILRGIEFNGQWFYGVQGMSAARLPAENWIAQINKCRALIYGAHGMEPTYRSGGEISVAAPLATALEAILTTCQGRISEIGGVYRIHVGAPDAPVIHFTDDDILSTEEQTFTPFFGLADTINGIVGTYPSPQDGWVVKTAPPIYRKDLEALHGNRRLPADVSFDFVSNPEQVQRLMKSALEEGQRAKRHTLVLPPWFWPYCTPSTTISWSSKRNGYVNKMFRIDGVVDRANLDVLIDITEVDPSDYDWDSSSEFRPPVDGAVGAMRPLPTPIFDFAVLPDVAQDSNGNNRRCAILLIWDGKVTGVDTVMFEVRLKASLADVYKGRTEDVERGELLIAPGILLANTPYQVRARYSSYDGNTPFIWSDWIDVTTADIRLGIWDLQPISVDQLNKDISGTLEYLSGSRRQMQSELQRIGQLISAQDGANFLDKQELRHEMVSTFKTAEARFDMKINVATGENSALAQRIETLEVTIGDDISAAVDLLSSELTKVGDDVKANSTAITDLRSQVDGDIASAMDLMSAEIEVVDGRVTANARSIQDLRVEVGGVASSVTMRSEAHQSSEDGWASWGIQVLTGDDNNWSEAAMYFETKNNLSRAVFMAEQVIFSNGVDSEALLTFINGRLALQIANIGEITAGIIRSPDGNFVIDLANGSLRISDDD